MATRSKTRLRRTIIVDGHQRFSRSSDLGEVCRERSRVESGRPPAARALLLVPVLDAGLGVVVKVFHGRPYILTDLDGTSGATADVADNRPGSLAERVDGRACADARVADCLTGARVHPPHGAADLLNESLDDHVQLQELEDRRLQRHPSLEILDGERDLVDAESRYVEHHVVVAIVAATRGDRCFVAAKRWLSCR